MKSENISRLEIFCDDRNVMPIKRMLLGIKGVYEVNDEPVINAKPKRGGGVQAKTSGNIVDMFADYCRANQLDEVNADNVRDFQKTIGRSPIGYFNVIEKSRSAGLLKPVKGTGQSNRSYTVSLASVGR